jgi:ATP-dependent helicase/nuclease subunit A
MKLAYEHNGQRVEPEQFYAVACDPRRSVAVEACAGAGKTWMLVSRMVRALLEGCAPQEILAITFTKKAAGEMRQRLHEWLAEFALLDDTQLAHELRLRGLSDAEQAAAQASGQPAMAARLRGLQQALFNAGRPVQVRTFHSWFAALLRTAPLAVLQRMGLPAGYELLEDDSEAVAMVWRRFHGALLGLPQERADYEALVLAHGRGQTLKALEAALSRRTEFDLADQRGIVESSVPSFQVFYEVSRPEWRHLNSPADALAGPAAHARWHAWSKALGKESGATAPKAAAAIVDAFLKPEGAERLAALRRALFVSTADRLTKHLQKFSAAQEAEAELQALCLAQRQHEAWTHHHRMVRLCRVLVREFAALKHEQGWVDMNDVERGALVMLSDPVLSGWVQERLDARVSHLLIDEFQDTNPLQWQALHAWLSGYGGAGAAPSVFIVGDPKQSIYRFRRAEPQVFKAAQDFVVQGLGGDRLSCDHTRRNAPEVIDVVNQAMLQAQSQNQYEGFREHTTDSRQHGAVLHLPPIARSDKADALTDEPVPAWRDSLGTPRLIPEETLRKLECRQAARWLFSLMRPGPEGQRGLMPRDVMVLARKRDRLSSMQLALQELGVPTQQPEKSALADAPEVQDLMALLDALVSPLHDLSLARALKSPLFGLSDDDLVRIALLMQQRRAQAATEATGIRLRKPRSGWLALLQGVDTLPADWPAPLLALGPRLSAWQRWLDQLPPHDALDAIYHDGDVLARYAASAPPTRREAVLGNLRALLSAALQVDGARYVTAYSFVRSLRAGTVVAPAKANAQAVRLLTIHGAKGLEAPLVLMLDTDSAPARAESMGVLVDWPGEEAAPLSFVFFASESRVPPSAEPALDKERSERLREELNALYVALTRARQQLVISSVTPFRANDSSWWQRLVDWSEPAEVDDELADSCEAGQADTAPAPPTTCSLLQVPLPTGGLSTPGRRQDSQAPIPPKPAPGPAAAADPALAATGEAMHRLLEWLPLRASGNSAAALELSWSAERLQALKRDFGLTADQLEQALQMARRIALGEGSWAWDEALVDWAANEVPLNWRGDSLRLDRLVRRADTGQWWVLDYKSAATPERQDTLLKQLHLYAQAVAGAMGVNNSTVMAAFLTGNGALVPLPSLLTDGLMAPAAGTTPGAAQASLF